MRKVKTSERETACSGRGSHRFSRVLWAPHPRLQRHSAAARVVGGWTTELQMPYGQHQDFLEWTENKHPMSIFKMTNL